MNLRGGEMMNDVFSCEILDYFTSANIHIRGKSVPAACRNMRPVKNEKVLGLADLNDRVSSGQGLHRSPAALRLVVGPVVGLGLHLDLQAVRARAGRQLPVQRRQGWAVGGGEKKTCPTRQLNKQGGGGLILDALIKVECAECEHGDVPDLVINLL